MSRKRTRSQQDIVTERYKPDRMGPTVGSRRMADHFPTPCVNTPCFRAITSLADQYRLFADCADDDVVVVVVVVDEDDVVAADSGTVVGDDIVTAFSFQSSYVEFKSTQTL